jgi:antitoxin component YwqK of YwqJK toxin-antitoxin module
MNKIILLFLLSLSSLGLLAQNANKTDENGLKQGFWQKTHPNSSRIAYKGNFKDDKPIGTWHYFHPNGEISAELIYQESDTAYAKVFHYDGGLKATGRYFNQKKEGKWVFYDKRGALSAIQHFKNDLPHGPYRTYYLSGKIAEEMHYQDAELQGSWIRYHENGKIFSEVLYVDSKRTGEYKEISESGILLLSGNYKDDIKVGEWKHFLPNGRVNRVCDYDNISKQGEPDCKPINGRFEEFNDDEILMAVYHYKNGKKEGEFIEYYDDAYWHLTSKPFNDPYGELIENEAIRELRNHKVRRTGAYKNGKLHGKVIYYNKKGKVEKEEVYDEVE